MGLGDLGVLVVALLVLVVLVELLVTVGATVVGCGYLLRAANEGTSSLTRRRVGTQQTRKG